MQKKYICFYNYAGRKQGLIREQRSPGRPAFNPSVIRPSDLQQPAFPRETLRVAGIVGRTRRAVSAAGVTASIRNESHE